MKDGLKVPLGQPGGLINIAGGPSTWGKPVGSKDCTWRIWKIMRVTKEAGVNQKDWEDKMQMLGDDNLPNTGGPILGDRTNIVSKTDQLMDDDNKFDKVGLGKNERILLLAVCIGVEGHVDEARVFEMTNLEPFRTRNLSDKVGYPDYHNARLNALKDLEKDLNKLPPPPPWKL